MTCLQLLKHKDEVFCICRSFHVMIKIQFSTKVQILLSNNDGEYNNQEFYAYFQIHGLLHETSIIQTSQHNGIVKRKNEHILGIARALLLGAHMPSRDNTVVPIVHPQNCMALKVLNFETLLQVLTYHVYL